MCLSGMGAEMMYSGCHIPERLDLKWSDKTARPSMDFKPCSDSEV